MQTARREQVTEDQYLALEDAAFEKHEYVNGEMWAMAGGSPRHALLAMNFGRALGARLKPPCHPVGSDMRIKQAGSKAYLYPDVAVVCGKAELSEKDPNSVVNPAAIVEVLSDSTEAYDRGFKFDLYQQIPSIRTYILVAQGEPRVNCYSLRDGVWTYRSYDSMDAELDLPNLGVTVPLSEIYRGYENFPGDAEVAAAKASTEAPHR